MCQLKAQMLTKTTLDQPRNSYVVQEAQSSLPHVDKFHIHEIGTKFFDRVTKGNNTWYLIYWLQVASIIKNKEK